MSKSNHHHHHHQQQQQLFEAILTEIDKGNNYTSELVRLQNELTQNESELIALQIRFTHKNRENEELKTTLATKTKQLNERTSEIQTKSERLEWLEFHYDDLVKKYKLCMECMGRMRKENEELNFKLSDLQTEQKKITRDKHDLKEIFKDQIDDIDNNLDKLLQENESHVKLIADLKDNCERLQTDLKKSLDLNKQLAESKLELQREFEDFKHRIKADFDERINDGDALNQKLKLSELDNLKLTSKIDETNLLLNQMTTNYQSQLKQNESLKNLLKQKETQYGELKSNYENFLIDYQQSKHNYMKEKQEFEQKLKELTEENDLNAKSLELERNVNENHQKLYDINTKKLNLALNSQQQKIDTLLLTFDEQKSKMKLLYKKIYLFKQKFATFRSNMGVLKDIKAENDVKLKTMQEKYVELEQKYSDKCQLAENLEKELYMIRNSLDSALTDLNNLTEVLSCKSNEIIIKNKAIDQLESIVNQQNTELSKRNAEIVERIEQIEKMDRFLIEEKSNFDNKLASLEMNLKSKSKQLHQRIEQIKDMNEIVDSLKSQKDQCEFKLEQLESLVKCQRLEIESKSSMLKQFEFRIQDTINELNSVRFDLDEEKRKNQSFTIDKPSCIRNQETQTFNAIVDSNHHADQASIMTNSLKHQYQSRIEDLNRDVSLKEKLIDTINDELLLKDAEIARLKARIGIIERRD